jgi:hypothetical protein
VNKQREFELWVDVDAPEALRSGAIPENYQGFEVHKRLSGTPEFAAAKTNVASSEKNGSTPSDDAGQRQHMANGFKLSITQITPATTFVRLPPKPKPQP